MRALADEKRPTTFKKEGRRKPVRLFGDIRATTTTKRTRVFPSTVFEFPRKLPRPRRPRRRRCILLHYPHLRCCYYYHYCCYLLLLLLLLLLSRGLLLLLLLSRGLLLLLLPTAPTTAATT